MTIRVQKANVLIGDQTYPVGAVLDVPDDVAHRHVKAGTAAAVVAVRLDADTETADLAPPPGVETADASPRPGRRRAAVPES